MKKYLIIFLVLLSTSSFDAVSQTKLSELEVKNMLCHKWEAISIEIAGEKMPAEEKMYITFMSDGTFIDSQEGEENSNENWFYDHQAMNLTTGGVVKKIILINNKQLKLRSKMDGQNILVILKRVD